MMKKILFFAAIVGILIAGTGCATRKKSGCNCPGMGNNEFLKKDFAVNKK